MDEIFPIEDSLLPLQHGDVKEARYVSFPMFFAFDFSIWYGFGDTDMRFRFIPNGKHMGEPFIAKLIFDWVKNLFKKE